MMLVPPRSLAQTFNRQSSTNGLLVTATAAIAPPRGIVARVVSVHAHHPSAHITRTLASAVLLCSSSQVHGQAAASAQTFVIHGTPKTCSAITQLDSALSTDNRQFFAGWTEKDYADAVAWSQACAQYGWHVPGRPRISLLEAQHNKVRGSAQMQIVSGAAPAGAT